uniref:Gypsy retrotransposon integrase-like protein 1 n=1 Tax=Astyanax mexicanus TaxID=7994 RepID=A0A3B1IQA4_ASTMX
MRFREPEGQLARWISRLQEFSFEVVHRPGRSHGTADALSRRPCVAVDCKHCARAEEKSAETAHCAAVSADVTGGVVVAQVSVEQIRDAQRADRDLMWAVHALEANVTPSWEEVVPLGPVAKALRSNWASFSLSDGVLCHTWEDPANGQRVFSGGDTRALRDSVLRGVHGSPGAGHFGVTKTLKRLRQRFYWPGCRTDVELFVHCCDVCAAKKGPARAPRAPLHPYQCGGPMERVAVDVLGPFPVTDSGNRYVLVAMDYFTKWPEAYAVPDQGAVTTADVLVREFFCRFGVPEELHSDQGRNFESEVMAEVCRILGIHKTRTTPLHPQSDGLVERFNRTLAAQLAMVSSKGQRDWDKHLPVVLLACRSAVQETTGFTPALLMFGRELRTPVTLAFGAPPDGGEVAKDTPTFVSDLLSSLDLAHGLARSNQSAAGQKQKRAYDTRCFGDPLEAGARVWLYNPQRKKGLCPKLQSAWVGPCRVLSRLGEVVYRIRWGRRTMIVHRDRLAPYRPKLTDTGDSGAVPAGPAPEPGPNSGSSEPLAGGAVPGPSRLPRVRSPARLRDFVCD